MQAAGVRCSQPGNALTPANEPLAERDRILGKIAGNGVYEPNTHRSGIPVSGRWAALNFAELSIGIPTQFCRSDGLLFD